MVGKPKTRRVWRRFLPIRRSTQTQKMHAPVFAQALQRVEALQVQNFAELDSAINHFRKTMDQSSTSEWLALLILQAPRAAHAQTMMDEHPKGYHDRKKRLYELIDFNDTYDSVLLKLSQAELSGFAARLRSEIDTFCKKLYTRGFSEEQFKAIDHGLSREVAVYRAAQDAGLDVLLSSRTDDAFGIDMQIREPNSGRYINVDCKTASSYYFRLKDMVRSGRLSEEAKERGEERGWCQIFNRAKHEHAQAKIVLLRVDQDDLGMIHDYRFVDERKMMMRLREVIDACGINDGRFGVGVTSL